MKKEMISCMFLLSLFLVSFVAAETYTSTTIVAFNSGEENKTVVDNSDVGPNLLNNLIAGVSFVLIIIAAIMIYKKRKVKKRSKSTKKKVARKVSKKKTAKKKRK